MTHIISAFEYLLRRLEWIFLEVLFFLQDTLLFEAFINIFSEINGFPAGNTHAPVGEKTAFKDERVESIIDTLLNLY